MVLIVPRNFYDVYICCYYAAAFHFFILILVGFTAFWIGQAENGFRFNMID